MAGMDFGLGMGWWGLIPMLLFWGGLLAVAIWLVRLLFPNAPQDHHNGTNSSKR